MPYEPQYDATRESIAENLAAAPEDYLPEDRDSSNPYDIAHNYMVEKAKYAAPGVAERYLAQYKEQERNGKRIVYAYQIETLHTVLLEMHMPLVAPGLPENRVYDDSRSSKLYHALSDLNSKLIRTITQNGITDSYLYNPRSARHYESEINLNSY